MIAYIYIRYKAQTEPLRFEIKDTSSPLYGYFLYRGLEKFLFPAGDAWCF